MFETVLDKIFLALLVAGMVWPAEEAELNSWRIAAIVVAVILVVVIGFGRRDPTASIGRVIPPDRRLTRNMGGIRD